MKKILRTITIVLVLLLFAIQSVSAASVTITGTADKDALGVTILVLEKGTNADSFDGDDIVYVNQYSVKSDGSFSMTLPYMETQYYDFYSNMDLNVKEDTSGLLDVAYVATTGSDSGDGSEQNPVKTLSKAYILLNRNGKIIIKDSAAYVSAAKPVTIEGASASAVLILGSETSLSADLTFSNITLSGASTIYANGCNFTVESTVSTTDRLSVYGGKKSADVAGNTNVTLLGGKYNNIYGGGYSGKVSGNTNIILGGNANAGEGIDDDNTATLSPCMVYGGGENGSVGGKTNITLKDNAVAKYIVGAGTGTNGTANDTNITIEGGKVMNVYAGSRSTALPAGTQTHVTITGGTAEAIFGGCENVGLTGHTFVNLLGGQVTRRVFSGCYNNVSFGMSGLSVAATWSSSNHVTGTTNLVIGPNVKLNTKDGLSSDNSINVGVFSGSRMESQKDDEQNSLIFIDGSYSTHSQYIGEKSTYIIVSLSKYLKSFEDYTIKSSGKGTLTPTTTAGKLYAQPISDAYVVSCGAKETGEGYVTVATGTSEVNFLEKNFYINSVTANPVTESGVSGSADIFASNREGKKEPRTIVAVYDGGELISTDTQYVTASNANLTFNIDCTLEKGKTYTIKTMIWDKDHNPLTKSYVITIK